MRILSLIAAVCSLLIFTAVSLGDTADQNAAQMCRAQQKAMGTQTFRDTYGTNQNKRNAFGKCVSKIAQQNQADEQNAAQKCRAERNADPAAFAARYGTNGNDRNAFGKCVSQKAKAQEQSQQEATINAAKACRAERAQDPAAFKTKYGTNHNKSNAFGKCVSTKAKEK